MINFKKFNSIISITAYFNSDDKCKQAIIESRWGVGNNQDVICPYCVGHQCVVRKDGKFRCKTCGKNFFCLVSTIFVARRNGSTSQCVHHIRKVVLRRQRHLFLV